MTTWRVTDSRVQLSGKGESPEAAMAALKQKIRVRNAVMNQAYRRIRSQM